MRRGDKIVYTYEKNGYRGCRFTCDKEGRFIGNIFHGSKYQGPPLCWVKLIGNKLHSRVPRAAIKELV